MTARVPSLRAAALCLAALACGQAGAPGETALRARYGEPFDLPLGRRASVGGELDVTFARVAEDSRCPTGTDCPEPGNAAAVFAVDGDRGSATLTLHTGREPRRIAAAGHALELVELRPARSPGAVPDSADYEVTLVVRPAP